MARMTERLAQHTIANYVCSGCWGNLSKTWVVLEGGELQRTKEGEVLCEVVCQRDQIDLGFVTKHFVEKTRVKDFDNAFEVKRDLIKLGIITKEKAYAD